MSNTNDSTIESKPDFLLEKLNGKVFYPPVRVFLPPKDLSLGQFKLLLEEKVSPEIVADPSKLGHIPERNFTTGKPAYAFPAFRNWLLKLQANLQLQHEGAHTFRSHPYKLLQIEFHDIVWFGPNRIGFAKIKATIETDKYAHKEKDKNGNEIIVSRSDWLPGNIFLRGGSVAILLILQPDDVEKGTDQEKYVVMCVQPRIPAGSFAFTEIPAGMLDDGRLANVAVKEVEEEVGITIEEKDLFNMSEFAVKGAHTYPWTALDEGQVPMEGGNIKAEQLHDSMYPSVGGCDEFISLMLYQARLPRPKIDDLRGKATGLRQEGEAITLKLVRLEDLWKEGARDAKALSALALYQGLKQSGSLPEIVERKH